ncbi:MAG: glycosyltransferase N-terminal domain-containing protein [Phycisphaerales bacterium]|jgi:3-deoxy-D-manno-octulosonic-acid transferase
MNLLDLIYVPLAIVTAPWWAGKKRSGWGDRFGRIPPLPHATRPRVLLHAVSVGEVSALRQLVPLLREECDVVVSATTDTGLARARELFELQAHVVRYPLDFSWSVARFLSAVQPHAVGLVELEVWPNFVRACGKRRVPVAIINGRLSARSSKGYRKLGGFFRRLLGQVTLVACQDEDYAARFRSLGATRVEITGSMKWDATVVSSGPVEGAAALAAELGVDVAKPLIVAGSTGPGEEAVLHGACPEGVQLLCAPRKPDRFDEAAAALPGCVRLSRVRAGIPASPGAMRFLVDTIGDLRKAYSLATVVVVGRSFIGDLYGSDPIEPISLCRATVIGPHVADFARIVEAFAKVGGIMQISREGLPGALAKLSTDLQARNRLVENGLRCIAGHQGASAAHAKLLARLAKDSHGFRSGK